MIDIATMNTLIAAARVEVEIAEARTKAYRGQALTDESIDALVDFAYAMGTLYTLEMVRDGHTQRPFLVKIVDRARQIDPNLIV